MAGHKKNLLILLVLIIFVAGLSWWLIRPALKNIRENNTEISYQKEKLARLLQEGQSVVENKKNLAMVEAEINELEGIWLKVGNELKFITDLEQAAAKNNLEQVINFDNTKYEGDVDIRVIPISLDLQGSLENIMFYINDLEAYDYYININKVEIKSSGSQTTKKFSSQVSVEGEEGQAEEVEKISPILSIRLDGVTYWK